MYPFSQSVSPAVRSHMDAQAAFLNELSQTMSRSFQQVIQLNLQLGQTLFEEAAGTARRMLNVERAGGALPAAAAIAQPATDTLRAYQQHMSELAAGTQVDLTRMSGQQAQETSHTARALADDVTRASADATDKSLSEQEAAVTNAHAAFVQAAASGARMLAGLGANVAQARPDVPAPASDDSTGGYAQPGSMMPSPAR